MASHTMNGKGQDGFTYISLLFVIVVLGFTAGVAGRYWGMEARREAEKELIFRGSQIAAGIKRYYEESPGARAYPRSLADIVDDKRYPVAKRHLRKVYSDPMTGKPDWKIVKAPDGGVMGVASSSEKEPLKKKGFSSDLKDFDEKTSYAEWAFVFVPVNNNPPAVTK